MIGVNGLDRGLPDSGEHGWLCLYLLDHDDDLEISMNEGCNVCESIMSRQIE